VAGDPVQASAGTLPAVTVNDAGTDGGA